MSISPFLRLVGEDGRGSIPTRGGLVEVSDWVGALSLWRSCGSSGSSSFGWRWCLCLIDGQCFDPSRRGLQLHRTRSLSRGALGLGLAIIVLIIVIGSAKEKVQSLLSHTLPSGSDVPLALLVDECVPFEDEGDVVIR